LRGRVSFGERIGRHNSTSLGAGDFFRVGNVLDGTDFLLGYAGIDVYICSCVSVVVYSFLQNKIKLKDNSHARNTIDMKSCFRVSLPVSAARILNFLAFLNFDDIVPDLFRPDTNEGELGLVEDGGLSWLAVRVLLRMPH
jgi:hypothetical protein